MDVSQLLALKDAEELRRRFATVHASGALNTREFVDLMRILLAEYITDELQFTVQAMDIFRQVDLSSKGVITFNEFSNHIMHLDVLSDEAVIFRSFRYRRCIDTIDDFHGNAISYLSHYGSPVDRIIVVTERSDHVYLYVPSEGEGELPRPSVSLGHFAVIGHMRILTCEQLADENAMVTSTCTQDESAFYLNYWELPRSKLQERGPDSVFIATMRHRTRVVNPQVVLFRSSIGVLLTAGDHGNCIQVWRTTNHKLRVLRKFTLSTRPITCMLELRWLGVGSCVLVAGSKDGTMTLVDMTKLAMEKDLPVKQVIVQIVRAHEYGVVAMCQSKKHKLVFSAGVFREEATCRVSVWRGQPNSDQPPGLMHEAQLSLAGHAYQVVQMRVVDEEDQLITADLSGELRVWELPELTLQQVIYSRTCDRKSNPLRTIAIMGPSPEAKDVPYTIMVASNVIELHQKARVRQKDTIISSFYNERFKHFVVVGARRIYMWNAYTGILAKTYNIPSLLQGKASEITACCFGDEGNSILFGDDKGRIFVCSYAFGTLLKQLDPHQGPVTWLHYCQMDKTVVSMGADGRIRVLDDRDPDGHVDYNANKSLHQRSVALREIAITQSRPSSRGGALLRSMRSQKAPQAGVNNDSTEVIMGACSPEFSLIATVCANATDIADVNVWDYETSTLLASVLEPEGRDGSAFAATALAFATPFPLLAGGTENGMVHLWRIPSMEYVATLTCRNRTRRPSDRRRSSAKGSHAAMPSGFETMAPAGITSIACGKIGDMLVVYAGDEYGCLSSWFLDECQVHELTRDHTDHGGSEDGDDQSSLGSASVNSLGSTKSRQASGADKANNNIMAALTGRFLASPSSSATPTTLSSSAASSVQVRSNKTLKFAGAGGRGMADTNRRGLSLSSTPARSSRPSLTRVRVADDQIIGPGDGGSRGSQRSLGNVEPTKGQSSYYSNRIRKVSRRYTQKGYNARRLLRVRVATEKILLIRKVAARVQEAHHTRRLTIPSSKHWHGHQDRVSNLSFINSSLTLVSAGADNVMHVWDATRATLLGTLDLQEPGTHVNGWKYTVVEDEAMQRAAVTQEARKLLLSTKELHRLAKKRRKALKKKLKTLKVVVAMGLMEVPSPADILRQQALQAIKDSPVTGNAAGPDAQSANPMSPITTPGDRRSQSGSPKAMSPRARAAGAGSRGKPKDKWMWRNKTWTDILNTARESEVFMAENELQYAIRTPTARELRIKKRLERQIDSGVNHPASAVSLTGTSRRTTREAHRSKQPHTDFLDMAQADGEDEQAGGKGRTCGCKRGSRRHVRRYHREDPQDLLVSELEGEGPFFKDPFSTQYFKDVPQLLSDGDSHSPGARRRSVSPFPPPQRQQQGAGLELPWLAKRSKEVIPEAALHDEYAKLIQEREKKEREGYRQVKGRKVTVKSTSRPVIPPPRKKEMLITILNKLNHMQKTPQVLANPSICRPSELLRLDKNR